MTPRTDHLPRILIVEDHSLVAEAFKSRLDADYEVVGIVSDGYSLVRIAAELSPDLIVLDVDMPILNGLDAGQQIKELLPRVKLVYATMNEDATLAAEAFRRGASGYFVKTSELVIAVREVLRGRSYVSAEVVKDTLRLRQGKELVGKGNRLTDRQRQVLQLLAGGMRMKEVGLVLKITARTVAFHKYRVMKVLKAKNDANLVQYAIKHHMIAA